MVGSEVFCDSALAAEAFGKSTSENSPPIYDDDMRRCFANCESGKLPIIVYGELGSETLNPFLKQEYGGLVVLRHFVKVSTHLRISSPTRRM